MGRYFPLRKEGIPHFELLPLVIRIDQIRTSSIRLYNILNILRIKHSKRNPTVVKLGVGHSVSWCAYICFVLFSIYFLLFVNERTALRRAFIFNTIQSKPLHPHVFFNLFFFFNVPFLVLFTAFYYGKFQFYKVVVQM